MILLQGFQPNAIVCDLDLGSGPSGVDLLTYVAREQPWVGMVVLTAHAAPELAVPSSAQLPSDVVYLVKSAIKRPEEITEAIDAAIALGLKRVEAGAQGGHKLARGYEPVETWSAHYIVHPGFRTAVADFLERERQGVAQDRLYLAERAPFKKE